jgi:hypothetical protein
LRAWFVTVLTSLRVARRSVISTADNRYAAQHRSSCNPIISGVPRSTSETLIASVSDACRRLPISGSRSVAQCVAEW